MGVHAKTNRRRHSYIGAMAVLLVAGGASAWGASLQPAAAGVPFSAASHLAEKVVTPASHDSRDKTAASRSTKRAQLVKTTTSTITIAGLSPTVSVRTLQTPSAQPSPAAASAVATSDPGTGSKSAAVSPIDPAGGVFGPKSTWRTSIAGAPVASDSTELAQSLAHEVTSLYNGVAAFQVYGYTTNFYTVGPNQATTSLTWDNCQSKSYYPPGLSGAGGILTNVPVPSFATGSPGTDGEMTIYSPSLNQLWEFWVVKKTGSGWSACWGGHMTNVSANPGYFSGGFGATATGLPVAGGMLTIHDVDSGVVNHAISLLVPNTAVWTNYSWPAQRSDGGDTASNAIPEGTRFKLPASVNVNALHMSPIAKMIAKAAQTYGFVVTDTAGAVAVQAESGIPLQQTTGTNPWYGILGSTPTYDVLANFPWSELEAIPENYGKP